MSQDDAWIFVNSTGDTFTPTHSGAIATWIWEMCRAGAELGIEPWVITRSSEHAAYPWTRTFEIDYPFPPRIRGSGRFWEWARRRRGWAHIRQGHYLRSVFRAVETIGGKHPLLMFHNDPEAAVCARRRFPGARIVHLFHNCNRVAPAWRDRFADSVDVALAVSSFCARWNESHFGCAIQTLRNGVDVRRFSPLPKAQNATVRFGFVGRTDRQKAPDLMLRALLRATRERKDFEVQILGSRFYGAHVTDPYQNTLLRLVERLRGVGIPVHAPGFVNRLALPREIARADVHVVPSRWEDPCPLTVLEGMATGAACVVSRSGGVPEQVGDAALCFDRDDLDGLHRAVMRLLGDAGLRAEYGARARKRAEARPWSVVFSDLLESVVG
jgi:glycosyltransferase involved in cell wall biosynthesis